MIRNVVCEVLGAEEHDAEIEVADSARYVGDLMNESLLSLFLFILFLFFRLPPSHF